MIDKVVLLEHTQQVHLKEIIEQIRLLDTRTPRTKSDNRLLEQMELRQHLKQAQLI